MYSNVGPLKEIDNSCSIHSEKARKRWLMLARALLKMKDKENVSPTESNVSFGQCNRFGLFSISPLQNGPDCYNSNGPDSGGFWFVYSAAIDSSICCVKVRHLVKSLTPIELMGFNNTGNVCVWPSEEALAYYCLRNKDIFRDKSVLELGGGMTCLAGLLLAKYASPAEVLLTDGNLSSVDNVQAIIDANNLPPTVRTTALRWGCDAVNQYDIVLAADCLFFDDTRTALVSTIWNCLKSNGHALITAPARGDTHEKFLKTAESFGFIVKSHGYDYNPDIFSQHLKLEASDTTYKQDIHYPRLTSLFKP